MKINVKSQKLIETIKKVETRKRANLIPVDEIPGAIIRAEEQLKKLGIPKKIWEGCDIVWRPGAVANSYYGRPEGSYIRIKRYHSGWFAIDISRVTMGKQPHGAPAEWNLVLSIEAHNYLSRWYRLQDVKKAK